MKMLRIEKKKYGHRENHEVGVEKNEDPAVIETPVPFQTAGGFDHAPEGHEGGDDLPMGRVEGVDVGKSAKAQADGKGGHAEKDAAHQRLLPQSEDGQAKPHQVSL